MKSLIFMVVVALSCFACGETKTPPASNPDAGTNIPQCFNNPQTHAEIINACTDALAIDKTPVLPLLNADGTLPPLP